MKTTYHENPYLTTIRTSRTPHTIATAMRAFACQMASVHGGYTPQARVEILERDEVRAGLVENCASMATIRGWLREWRYFG